jgi:hypothetical protein
MNHFKQLRDELSVVLSFLDAQTAVAMLAADRNTQTFTKHHRKTWKVLLKRRYNETTLQSGNELLQFQRMWRAEQQTYARHNVQIESERQRTLALHNVACAAALQSIFDRMLNNIISYFVWSIMFCCWLFGYVRVAQCLLLLSYSAKNTLRFRNARDDVNYVSWLSILRDGVYVLLGSGELFPSLRVFGFSILVSFSICGTAFHTYHISLESMRLRDLYGTVKKGVSYVLLDWKSILIGYSLVCSSCMYIFFVALVMDGWKCSSGVILSSCFPMSAVLYLVQHSRKGDVSATTRTTFRSTLILVIGFCMIGLTTVFATMAPQTILKPALATLAACFYFAGAIYGMYHWKETASLWPKQHQLYFPLNPRIPADRQFDSSNPQTSFL